jgi:hypothetical protein
VNRLDQSDLLNEQVHADELQELLARLAATDALFSEAVPTIRDVAEATDASPLLIGRILSQMRGPEEVAELKGRMDGFEARLRELEGQRVEPSVSRSRSTPPVNYVPREFKSIDFNKLLGDSGAGDYRPDLSWNEQKRLIDFQERGLGGQSEFSWHGDEPAHRIGRIVVSIFVGILVCMLVIANNPRCNFPESSADRPIPFPIERSTR